MTIRMDSSDYFKNLIDSLGNPYSQSSENMDHPLSPPQSEMFTRSPEIRSDAIVSISNKVNTPLLSQYMDLANKGDVARPAPFDWGSGTPEYVSEVLAESMPSNSLPYFNEGAKAQRRSTVNVDGTMLSPDGAALPDIPINQMKNIDELQADPVFNWTNRATDPTPDYLLNEEELKAVDIIQQLASHSRSKELRTFWDELELERLDQLSSFPEAGESSMITQARRDPAMFGLEMKKKIKSFTYRILASMDYQQPQWFNTNLLDPGAVEQGSMNVYRDTPSFNALITLTGFNLSYEDSKDPKLVMEAVDDFVEDVFQETGHRQNIIRGLALGRPIHDMEGNYDFMSLVPENPLKELKVYDPETKTFNLMEVSEALADPKFQARVEQYQQDIKERDRIHTHLSRRHEFGPPRYDVTETWGQSLQRVLKRRYEKSGIGAQANVPWGGETQVLTRLATGEEHSKSLDRRGEAINYSKAAEFIGESRGPERNPIPRFPDIIRDYPNTFMEDGLIDYSYAPMSAAYQPPIMDKWGWWIQPPSDRANAAALALMFPIREKLEHKVKREELRMNDLTTYLARDINAEIAETPNISNAEMIQLHTEKASHIDFVISDYIKKAEEGADVFYVAKPFIDAGILDNSVTKENYIPALKAFQEKLKQVIEENSVIYSELTSPLKTYDGLMLAAMNEGLGTSFVTPNQVNELVFAAVLDKDKFSRGERLNILRTWNMAHTTFVKQLEDQNADVGLSMVSPESWNNGLSLTKSGAIWGAGGISSNESFRKKYYENDQQAILLHNIYQKTFTDNYLAEHRALLPNVDDKDIAIPQLDFTKPIDYSTLSPVALQSTTSTWVRMLIENPMVEGVPNEIVNWTNYVDTGLAFGNDPSSFQGEGGDARRDHFNKAVLMVTYFANNLRENTNVRTIASDFGFTKQELIAADLVHTLARANDPRLNVNEIDITLDFGRTTDKVTSIQDQTRQLYKVLARVYAGDPTYDREIGNYFDGVPTALTNIPWGWQDNIDQILEVDTDGDSVYSSLAGKFRDVNIRMYDDEESAKQGIAHLVGTSPAKLTNESSPLWYFIDKEKWDDEFSDSVDGMNLAAMSIIKLYGLDSRLRERMGMALYASATEMQTQTMHGLVGIAKATTIETEDVQIVGVDQDTNQPLVTSRQLPLPVVKRGMDNVHAGMSTPEAIGYEWNADTPENGMLGWITLLDPNEKSGSWFMKGLRENFSSDMAEYQGVISEMPGETYDERKLNFEALRERAIREMYMSYCSPEVMKAYHNIPDSTTKTGSHVPYKTDIHLDVLRRMMLDDAWPSRPYGEGSPNKHFQKGLYVDNDGSQGTFGGELVDGTTDTWIYRKNVKIQPLTGTEIMAQSGAGEAGMGHVKVINTATLEQGADVFDMPVEITVPWILFGEQSTEEFKSEVEKQKTKEKLNTTVMGSESFYMYQ